jgi:hypothetical protein
VHIRCAECQGEEFLLVLSEDGSTQLVCRSHDDHMAGVLRQLAAEILRDPPAGRHRGAPVDLPRGGAIETYLAGQGKLEDAAGP